MTRRRTEPRLVDPATDPRRYVSLRTTALYLGVHRHTLNKFLAANLLACKWFAQRRKIAVVEIVAFEARCSKRNGELVQMCTKVSKSVQNAAK